MSKCRATLASVAAPLPTRPATPKINKATKNDDKKTKGKESLANSERLATAQLGL